MTRFNQRPVYIVDGARTPFLKARNVPGPFSAADLAVAAGRDLLMRQTFEATDLDEVILGSAVVLPQEANIARIVSLRLGCGDKVPAFTVQRNCASGMQAIDEGASHIADGRSHLVLVGGTDAMSHGPLLFPQSMAKWLGRFASSKTLPAKLKQLLALRPGFFKPQIGLLLGLTDPIVNLSMGQTAENLAKRFTIAREAMDDFARESHRRALAAIEGGHLEEVVTIFDKQGRVYESDDGVRHPDGLQKLGKLKPVFDKVYGNVTAGNSSQVTDGAALLLLASEQAVKRFDLPVLGQIKDIHWAGLAPAEMGLGPVMASTPMLQRHGLDCEDVDAWEINEAFAAQVMGCLRAWEDEAFCREYFPGVTHAFGSIAPEKLNVDGGAIAMGHPIGATGARIVLHLCHVLKRQKQKTGVATLCIGGGQGGAVLVEGY